MAGVEQEDRPVLSSAWPVSYGDKSRDANLPVTSRNKQTGSWLTTLYRASGASKLHQPRLCTGRAQAGMTACGNPKMKPGLFNGTLTIKTNHQEFSTLEVPVTGYILD
jgi:hypothetical protein